MPKRKRTPEQKERRNTRERERKLERTPEQIQIEKERDNRRQRQRRKRADVRQKERRYSSRYEKTKRRPRSEKQKEKARKRMREYAVGYRTLPHVILGQISRQQYYIEYDKHRKEQLTDGYICKLLKFTPEESNRYPSMIVAKRLVVQIKQEVDKIENP